MAAFAGDVPDFFYVLDLEGELADGADGEVPISGYFWIEDLDVAEVRAALGPEASRFDWDGADSIVLTVPLMGWSWALAFAQWTLEECLEETAIELARRGMSNRLKLCLPLFGMLSDIGIRASDEKTRVMEGFPLWHKYIDCLCLLC